MDDGFRHDGGPLEKPHVRELVQKNLLENNHFEKKSKTLEVEKKAMIRTTSRDEFEIRLLLQKLQLEQQTMTDNEETRQCTESEEESQPEVTDEGTQPLQVCEWNPYPVTIVSKFRARGQGSPNKIKDDQGSAFHISNTPARDSGISGDVAHDDSGGTASPLSRPGESQKRGTFLQHDLQEDWVGNPSAILSVRRARKTISEQVHKNLLIRSQTDIGGLKDGDRDAASSPTRSTSSLSSPRTRSNSFNNTTSSGVRRSGSVNERANGARGDSDRTGRRPVARSFSMLSHMTLKEMRTDSGRPRAGRRSITFREDGMSSPRSPDIHSNNTSLGKPNKKPILLNKTGSDGDSHASPVAGEKKAQNKSDTKDLVRKDTPPKTVLRLGFSSSLDENAFRSLGPRRKHVYKPTADG